MRTVSFRVSVLIMLFIAASASTVRAQSRTWVSALGDDANPCSRLAPCKTFASAQSKTASGGEIDALDPGGYGAVTIIKSLTIDGSNTLASILAAGTSGIIINAPGGDVTIRGLTINGATTGIKGITILAASKVFIERCVIFQFRALSGGRGISDERTTAGSLFVTDTIIRNNGSSGAAIYQTSGSPAIKASFDRCRFEGNGNAGLLAGPGSIVSVKDSVSTGNAQAGFHAEGGVAAVPVQLNIENSLTANNGQGITVFPGGTVRIARTQITNNSIGLNPVGTGVVSSNGTNIITANASGNGPPNGPGIPVQ
jgi:Right handed beta helix region